MQNRRAADVAAIVPLPISVVDPAAALAPLAGVPPLARVVATLRDAAVEPGCIVVAVAATLGDGVRDLLDSHDLADVRIATASHDGTRAHCLTVALDLLAGETDSPTFALLCDIRQPLTPVGLCARVIERLTPDAVVLPALQVTDSVKLADGRGTVTGTLDRATLRTVQYPRGFAIDTLTRLLAGRASDQFDDVAEVLRAGVPVATVDGDPGALAVNLPGDAPFVEAIIAASRGR